ncbi:MAG: type II toxin-antitoxin system YoeB family toxin [Defluviitaleaceae bacterium]|nr:type II toxin-antitoxin system YoeB family toxin [Defluviitaleaceae bacterium]
MKIDFTKIAHKELSNFKKYDKNTANKIYKIIEDIVNNGSLDGIGHPEQLKYYKNPPRFSRHINKYDRLVYSIDIDIDIDNNILLIISCKGHYED